MRVALATWNGRISPVFDVSRHVEVLDIQEGVVAGRHEEALPGTDPHLQASRMASCAAEVLICGAISQGVLHALLGIGIRVISFTSGATDEVLAAWLAGRLPNPAMCMPGCGGRGRRCRGGGGGGRRGTAWATTQPSDTGVSGPVDGPKENG